MANIVEFEGRASIERQAREWLVHLDGDHPFSTAEQAALHDWMARSPAHRDELNRLQGFWAEADVLRKLAVSQETGPHGHPRVRLPRAQIILAAASVLLASLILTCWFVHRSFDAANGIYGTAIGQLQTISLPDRSSIQLNTDSQVQVTYSPHLRHIRLLRGEALFSVTPDPTRPFEVYANNNVVRAVGTAFTVHLEPNKVDVTVTNGVVDVSATGTAPAAIATAKSASEAHPTRLGRLKAGQTATLGNQAGHIEVHQLAEPELRRRIAWREGYLSFSGEPLSEVVEQLNRYSPVNLTIGDARLAALPIGGRFRIGDLDAVLDALRTNFSIHATPVDERDIRLESDHQR